MKRLMVAAGLMLMAMPGTAMAQDWKFSSPNADKECFAMTFRDRIMIGVQATNTGRAGGIMIFAPAGTVTGTGDPVITLSAGRLAGPHIARDTSDAETNSFFMRVETMDDFASMPDSFHLKFVRGGQTVLDTQVTGFRAALGTIQRCVAAR